MTQGGARVGVWGGVVVALIAATIAGVAGAVGAESDTEVARDRAEAAAWIAQHAIPLATTEPGSGTSDLQPIRSIVGNARVVALGEATHGTREFFQLKHRMLEFLVEEMGFTAFEIEASMPVAFDVDRYVLTGEGDPAGLLSGLENWTWDTQEVLDLVRWMRAYNADPAHPRKVRFYGFDAVSASRSARVALDYVRRVDRGVARPHERALRRMTSPWFASSCWTLPSATQDALTSAASRLLATFDARRGPWTARTGDDEWALAREHALLLEQSLRQSSAHPGTRIRDQFMADNVRWILEREGPAGKLVIWAHNGHVATSASSMGFHLREALGNDLVVFGFTFDRGSFQAIDIRAEDDGLRPFTVGAASELSLEAAFAAARIPVAVLDLRRLPESGPVHDWLAVTRPMRSVGAIFDPTSAFNFEQRNAAASYDAIVFVAETNAARATAGGVRQGITADAPRNLDFEEGAPGTVPAGWRTWPPNPAFGFTVETNDASARHGSRCARVGRPAGPHPGEAYALLFQGIDAAPYRGKPLTVRAWIRTVTHDPASAAYLWVTAFPLTSTSRGTAWMLDRPIRDRRWREYEVAIDVPEDASQIRVGLAFEGTGDAYLDDVRLVGASSLPATPSPKSESQM
jgi:erythromycin esterase